jgi:hypothetical protein
MNFSKLSLDSEELLQVVVKLQNTGESIGSISIPIKLIA